MVGRFSHLLKRKTSSEDRVFMVYFVSFEICRQGGQLMALTIREIEAARIRIAPYILQTPLLRMKNLDQYLGCEVYAKAECMQTTGSFKLRGAMNKILSLSEEELR